MAVPVLASSDLDVCEDDTVLDVILDTASLSHLSRPLKDAGENMETLEAKLNEGGRSALLQHLKAVR